jgi:hypothetical protein
LETSQWSWWLRPVGPECVLMFSTVLRHFETISSWKRFCQFDTRDIDCRIAWLGIHDLSSQIPILNRGFLMDLCYRGWCLQHASIAIFVLGGNVAQNMKLEAFWRSETFILWRNLNQPCGFKLCAAHSSGDPLHDYGHKTGATFGNRIRSYRDTETLVLTFYHIIEIRHSSADIPLFTGSLTVHLDARHGFHLLVLRTAGGPIF